jgi:AcrR family transcriptional regulator
MRAPKHNTEIRRDQIARAALELIAERGMGGLRVAAVARRVGLVPSGIYRHYAGKGEVIDAIVGYIRDQLLGNVRAVRRQEPDPLGRLHALLGRHVQLIRQSESLPVVIFSDELYGGDSTRRAKLRGAIDAYLRELARLVRDAQQAGAARRDVAPLAAARMFLGLIQSTVILWHLSGKRFDMAEQAEVAWQVFCRGLGPKPASNSHGGERL